MHKGVINIIGQRFGKLTVDSYAGSSKWNCLCGCGNKIIISGASLRKGRANCGCVIKLNDLTGQKFGILTVLSYAGHKKWTCLCDCGKKKDVRTSYLKRVASCGCKLAIDLTGQRFGKLVVISRAKNKGIHVQWNCLCDCGRKKVTSSHLLRSGQILRCGLCPPLTFKDLTGQKFGRLTVVSQAEKDKNNRIRWNCVCDCGHKITPYSTSLISGRSKSCGCIMREITDLTGQKFGKLLVLSQATESTSVDSSHTKWSCLCDCGKKCVVMSRCLTGGNTKSCGCLLRYADPTLSSKKSLYSKYKRSAKSRGHFFDMDFDSFMNLVLQPCHYCGDYANHYYKAYGVVREGGFLYSGLDRIDGFKGYQLDNVVPCCKKCNYLKWTKNEKIFSDWLKACHDHLLYIPISYQTSNLPVNTLSAQRSLYWIYKNECAKYRGYSFDLSLEVFIQLTQQKCFYCGSTPSRNFQKSKSQNGFLYNGLDRIDNHMGYSMTNVVTCCKSCNESKSDLSQKDFIDRVEKCYNFLNLSRSNLIGTSPTV